MLSFRAPLTFAAVCVLVLSSAQGEGIWQHTVWHGEAAWSAPHGKHLAVISEERERLIYFGSADGEHNVLSAPAKQDPSEKSSSPNWGGHRFWLGPQSRWGWPPPRDWEFSPAASAEGQGNTVVIHEPQRDTAYPAIERAYAWEGERLRCAVRWKGGDRLFYGMHVVAIQIPAEFDVQLHPSEHAPQGIVAVNGDHPNGTSALPHRAVTVDKGRAVVRSGVATGKFGFQPQPLAVRRGDVTFVLHPGPLHGVAAESPDFGYMTQLWVGDASASFCEMEQITPFLKPAADGWCGSTVYLELRETSAASN